jgi:hypothetical protein
MVFATPLRQLFHDETNTASLPGLRHLDSSIWTRKPASIYRDFCKNPSSPDTDGNSPYHRAVMCNSLAFCTINACFKDNSTLMTIPARNKDNPDFENVPLLVNFAKWNNKEN